MVGRISVRKRVGSEREREWDQSEKAELVEGPVERVSWKEKVKAIREMKVGKATGPSEVSVEMIAVSGEIGIGVMVELCQGVLDGREMVDDWAPSVVVPILKGNGMSVFTCLCLSCESLRPP